jgi:hypothetical protein
MDFRAAGGNDFFLFSGGIAVAAVTLHRNNHIKRAFGHQLKFFFGQK